MWLEQGPEVFVCRFQTTCKADVPEEAAVETAAAAEHATVLLHRYTA